MDRTPRLRSALLGDERGFSLVEMMVVLAIMGVVVSAFVGILASIQQALVRETNRSTTMDQARLAMEAIDREVRSGSIMCVTTAGSPPVYTLTLYSLSAYTASDSTTKRWIQYRVVSSSQTLERRQSTSTDPLLSTATWPATWRTLTAGIVNSSNPFALDAASQYLAGSSSLSRLLNVTFVVNSKTSDTASSSATIRSSVAIRNVDTSLSCSS